MRNARPVPTQITNFRMKIHSVNDCVPIGFNRVLQLYTFAKGTMRVVFMSEMTPFLFFHDCQNGLSQFYFNRAQLFGGFPDPAYSISMYEQRRQ